MAQSKVAGRIRRNHQRYRGRHGLNVVPMIDMMVILVFFLIFSAVFTKTHVLELNLPGADAAVPDLPSSPVAGQVRWSELLAATSTVRLLTTPGAVVSRELTSRTHFAMEGTSSSFSTNSR